MGDTCTTQQELTALLQGDGEIAADLLDHWAAVSGSKPFFYYGEEGRTLDFAEFAALSSSIAGNLASLGVGKGAHVCVFVRNPLVAALAMFGIWKAGAVYCPINVAYSGRLLAYQINDTRPQLLIVQDDLLGALHAVAQELVQPPGLCVYEQAAPESRAVAGLACVARWAELMRPAPRPDVALAFDDAANIIYTSGTTGPSKGVVQPQRWMAQYTWWGRKILTRQDVIYNDLPMHHVGGAVFNVVRAAMSGCEVAVWERFSPTAFWQRIAQRGASTAVLLDVMIPWLAKAAQSARDRCNTLNKVHMQPLPKNHAAIARRFGFDFVSAGFGQTESGGPLRIFIEQTAQDEGTPADLYKGLSHAAIKTLLARLDAPLASAQDANIERVMGQPSPFFDVAVLDARDRVCAPGEIGQLALRPKLPALIMQEYLGKPEKTLEAWRNLWFHTGDAAVQHEGGLFAFVDRLGDRIRVRGENLSSFQVEDLLLTHPQVLLAAAFAIPAAEGDEDDIAAFCTVDGALSEQDLHAHCARCMPKYMRPRHIRIVTDIPRTATNKTEKYRLRAQLLQALG